MTGPLTGLRVLDLSRVLAGPWASQVLADLGADVIKVERPGHGDESRGWGPPWVRDPVGDETDQSAYFCSTNRGKRSVTVDLSHPEGRRIARQLAARADVVLENFKAGGAARLGLDHLTLAVDNPRLITCSITGFGQTGPRAHQPGYDFMVQAMGGIMSVTGRGDDEPGGGPVKIGVALVDVLTGLYAAIAILGALREREHSGHGRHVDLALLDVQVATLANQALNYLCSGMAPGRMGNRHPNIVPYEVFATADGHLVLAVGNDGQFARFAHLAGHPEWAIDPRFSTNQARVRHRELLGPAVARVLRTRSTRAWLEQLEAESIPAGPIHTLDQVFADPQVVHRELRRELDHPTAGTVPQVASPIRYDGVPAMATSAPPTLGQHTHEVLARELGLDDQAIRRLQELGVV